MSNKIVHLIGQLARGGAERQLIHLAGQLAARGWTQTVVSFGGGDAWNQRLEALGVPLYEIPRTPFKPWRLWQLARIFQREKPRIIQSWSPHVAQYARWAWGKRGAKTIYGVRCDLTYNLRTGQPLERLDNMDALTHADCAVSNSQGALDSLVRRHVKLPRTEVIYNIVVARDRANAAEPTPMPRIVAVGRLDRLKGFDCLLHAAGILAAEDQSFELILAGDGMERKNLESLASELKLDHCVRFLGAVDAIGNLLASSHMLIHPSKREGLSNTILEGMAAGLPVISTVECASEIIEDGRTGILIHAGKPAVLADAMRRLLETPSLRGRLGEAARHYVERVCNAEAITTQYENVYRSLLNDLQPCENTSP